MLLYSQPILDLEHNEVCQHELLLRLKTGAEGEPLLPSSFLYVAERFNLIQDIDCWVARKAIGLIAEHARAGRRLVLHVNLAGKSIGDPRVAALLEEAVPKAGIDPACLVFELTETTAITNIEDARTFTRRVCALGFCGIREYARGFTGKGDVDAGPMMMGVSVGATGFALGAARAHGDADLYRELYRSTHLAGVPVARNGKTRFAAGGTLGNALLLAMLTANRVSDATGASAR